MLCSIASTSGEKNSTESPQNRTDHMMMVAAIEAVLVRDHAIVELNLGGQATLRKQFEGTVDRGVADGCVVFLDQPVQLFSGKMATRRQKNAQDCVPLRTLLEPESRQVLAEKSRSVLQPSWDASA